MANKLRLVHDNAVDRATVTGSTNVQPASNLKTGSKSDVWRASTTSGSINLSWANLENISCVSLPFSNSSASTLMRVRHTSELSSTNFLPYSENLSGWTSNGDTSMITAYGVAPDGTSTSNYLAGGTRFRTLTLTVGATYTYSMFVKQATGANVSLYRDGAASSPVLATFTFATKSLSGITAGATATSKELSDGWYRISLTFTTTIATNNFHVYVSGSNVEVWGMQVELGLMSSYYPSDTTFSSRSTVGTYIDANGLVASAAINTARMQYQFPSLGTIAPRLLIENAATNYATYSTDFTQTPWQHTFAGAATVPIDSGLRVSPSGATTANRVLMSRAGTTSSDYSLINLNATVPSAGTYVYSLWLKSNTSTNQNVVLFGSSTAGQVCIVTPEWKRFYITETTATTTFSVAFGTRGGTGLFYVGGDTSLDISVWGGQVEAGRAPTSFIYTTTTSVTRAADAITSSTSSTRPLGYMDWWQNYSYDTGFLLVNSSEVIKVPGLTLAQSASAYSYSGGRSLTVYTPATSTYNTRIDLIDPVNPQGYMEAAFIVAGEYFSPTYGAEIGATISMEDLSKSYRADAGNLKKDVSAKYKKINLDLDVITESNRTPIWKIVSYAGTSNPVWMSVFPSDSNPDKEQAYTIYGYFTKATEVAARSSNIYSTKFEVEGL